MPISRKTETEFKIKKMALEGMSARGIAKEVNMSNTTVSNYLRKLGMTDTSSYKLTNEEIAHRINEKYPTFEYIGGYIDGNDKIIVRCKVCGHEFEYTAQNLRPSRNANMQCRECNKRATEQKRADDKLTREAARQEEEEKKRVAKLKALKDKEISRICVECGEWFITTRKNSVCCSGECTKKRANNRKDRRLKQCDKVDYSITLTKLVKRDKGICHICGKKVDMNTDGNNDWYGSIDHIKAIANGGNHVWDNVKLAHRKCNTLKSDRKVFKGSNGQYVMTI